MKFLAILAPLLSIVAAQATTDETLIGPFGIVSTSQNRKYNNLTLTSIHVGAGINIAQLARAPAYSAQYYLNDTWGEPPRGRLAWPVPGTPYTFNGNLQFNTSSNIAPLYISVLQPLYSFSFGKKNELLIDGISKWNLCTVQTAYGPKQAVTWHLGDGKIDDPACVKIGLKRVKI